MKKKQFIFIAIGIAAAMLLAGCTINPVSEPELPPRSSSSGQIPIPDNDNQPLEEKGFNLSVNYEGDGVWTYTVKGNVPTPCHQFQTEVLIAESYPEQVTIIANVVEPDPDTICAQVITEKESIGNFQASEEANIILVVDQK